MANEKNTAVTVGGVAGAVIAALLGRLLGWMFGLQFILPVVVGLATAGALKKRMPEKAQVYVPALGVHAGYLTWVVLGILIQLLNHGFYMGFLGIFLHLVSVVGFVALIAQPGAPPAILLMLRHAYSLVLCLLSLGPMIKAASSFGFESLINTVVIGGIAIAMLILLGKALMTNKEA